jgi:predicted dehydrogenase
MESGNAASQRTPGKIRVGAIGVGWWAQYAHLPALTLLPEYELAAVCSRNKETAAALAAQHGFSHAVDSVQQLVSHPEVDLVLVLTPAPQHELGVRAAIAAGKDVYCEWPLTPSTALSEELLGLARQAGVRTIVGLQRRLAPGYRYVRDLLDQGYIGELRSVRLHVSARSFQRERPVSLAYTVPEQNFSSLLPVFGGHFLDVLFRALFDFPVALSALVVNQVKEVRLIETGEILPHTSEDQVELAGTFGNGAVLSVHLEAGKRNNFGVQIDITGSEGDLRISNSTSVGDAFNRIEGARGDAQPLTDLPVPDQYQWLPPGQLGSSVLELAHLYAAHARDVSTGSSLAPSFEDALDMHRLIDQIKQSSASGTRVDLHVGAR